MKTGGILLCGGSGTRLLPTTKYINKHLIPIYDKPMIYYSLSILLLSGLRNITIVCNKDEETLFKKLLGDGEELGIEISYSMQDSPLGIPDGISEALNSTPYEKSITVLGDNFIYGQNFFSRLENIFTNTKAVSIFSQKVKNPESFGVVELDNDNNVISVQEKPEDFISNDAVIGLYIFDNNFHNNFSNVSKSTRGEFEILDVVENYKLSNIEHHEVGRGTAWFDMGTTDSFYTCSSFVKTIQERQGLLVCSPHEIAYRNDWISDGDLKKYMNKIKGSEYSENLQYLIN